MYGKLEKPASSLQLFLLNSVLRSRLIYLGYGFTVKIKLTVL